jgi:hypothetical protein
VLQQGFGVSRFAQIWPNGEQLLEHGGFLGRGQAVQR